MSVQNESSESPGYCSRCSDAIPPERTGKAYCTEACYIRHRGEKVLSQIDSDHHICSTCYGRIKTTNRAKTIIIGEPDFEGVRPGRKDVSDGYQFRTERTTVGVDDASSDPHKRLEHTRWSCVCGAVDPQDHHDEIQAIDLAESMAQLFKAMYYLWRKGGLPHRPDLERYFDAFRDPWRGAEYACGRAVYG